jgi:hypothetical protein
MQQEIINHIRKNNRRYLKRYGKKKFKMVANNWYSIWHKVVSRKRIN